MGNEQSAPLGRRPQNKLSKPKTNGAISNLLSLNSNHSNPTTRQNSVSTSSISHPPYNFTPIEGFAGEAADRWRDDQPVQRKRMSLFRSKSSQDKPKLHLTTGLEPNTPEPSPLSSLDQPPLPRRSRGSSLKERGSPVMFKLGGEEPNEPPVDMSRPQIRNRNSLQTSNHQARLSLVAEVPSPQSEVPRRQSILEEDNNPIGQALTTRSNSDTAMYAPIRRKSLLAHGVATRASYVEPDPPQSHPLRSDSLNDMQNYHYNPSEPTSSPLSDLAMLGPKPAFMNDGPRAETPTDQNYGHLGGFNGTLRITNGAASPTPSSHKRANSLGVEEDYSEAKKCPAMGHRHGLSQRSNTISVPAEATKPPWMVRSESPLRTSQSHCERLAIDRQVPNDPSFSMFDFEEEKKHFKRKEVPTKAQELADDCRHDSTLSPFSFDNSPPVSPQFQVTSKHTALEDELFESEPSSPDPSAPPASSADHGSHLPRSFDSGYVGGEPSPTLEASKEPQDSASKGLAKADSGYSSNVSLRSFKKDSSPTKEPNRRVYIEPAPRVVSNTCSVESEASLRVTEPQPALPAEEVPERPSRQPPSPFRQAPPVPVEKQSFESTPRKVQPPAVPQARADQASSAPPQAYAAATPSENRPQENTLPVPGTSVREESPATSDASASPGSSSRWRQKLTKQHRVETGQVFTVQAIRSPSETYKIPPPTVEARRRLEEREEAFPVQSFPNTVEGNFVSRRMSMGTIFSVGSVEASDETNFARPPVPPMPTIIQEPAQQSRPEKNRRNTYQGPARSSHKTEQQEAESTQPVSRGRTPFPSQMANWARKSLQNIPPGRVPRQVEDFESHVSSLETVTSPPGRDADDGARPSIADQRAKSMTAQFEADAAARFAVSKQRNVSEASTAIRPRKSYDSIANSGSGTSTANSSRTNLRDASLVQNSAMRRSYTNLPAQPSLLNPDGVERRKSSKSPPPISMPNRVQSVTRKPVPPPQSQPARLPPPPPVPTPALRPSPLSQQQDALAWTNRRKSTASLLSTTTVSFETARRPDTYEIVDIDDFKKRHEKKRSSTIGLPLSIESAPNSRPTSSKGWGKSRDSMVISVRDRDEIPRTTYNDLGMKKKLRKSKESLHLQIRPRSSGPGLDAVSERDEMPRLTLQSPTLPFQSRRSTSKENIRAGSIAESQIPEVPKVVFDAYLSGAGDMGGQREIIRRKVKGRKSEEMLTLRDLQIEELAKRRPKSVQPAKSEQRALKERERERQEELKRLEQERGKEHRKSRWDAYVHIFAGDKEKKKLKERISAPMPLNAQEYSYGTAHTYRAAPVSQQQQEDEYYAHAQAHQQQDQLVLDRYAMRNNIMGNVRVQG